jgi:sugar phosphate permease
MMNLDAMLEELIKLNEYGYSVGQALNSLSQTYSLTQEQIDNLIEMFTRRNEPVQCGLPGVKKSVATPVVSKEEEEEKKEKEEKE